MDNEEYLISRFDRALLLLPQELRKELRALTADMRARTEEIRLRVGLPLSVVMGGTETVVGKTLLSSDHILSLIEVATLASPYSVSDAISSGYITARGGFRVGLCGSIITEKGFVRGYREYSSASVRISREVVGCAAETMKLLTSDNRTGSFLIVSPPGFGKTTFLRDAVRILSDGDEKIGISGMRTGLCDERSEIAAMYNGRPQFNIGSRTDVLDGCPKADAAMMLLRAMNPEMIVMDEITAPEDIDAIEKAANCGVSVIAAAHAGSREELNARPLYRRLICSGIFRKTVFIRRDGHKRAFEVSSL